MKFSPYTLAGVAIAANNLLQNHQVVVEAYSAYPSASIYGYKFGKDDSTYVDTSDWDNGNPSTLVAIPRGMLPRSTVGLVGGG